jgi:hypothetical protein
MKGEHSHLCPICHKAWNCTDPKCAPYNGVAHPDCLKKRKKGRA